MSATLILIFLAIFELWEHHPSTLRELSFPFIVEMGVVTLSLLFLMVFGYRRLSSSRKNGEPTFVTPAPQQIGASQGKQRILIAQADFLLGAGIESLLREQTQSVIHTISADDESNLIGEIRHYQPNVIILDESAPLDKIGGILDLFDYSSHLRVVGVSTQDGRVRVYDKNEITITRLGEFASVITGGAVNANGSKASG